jgi:O-antigen/teichoic acid export membrane protein
VSTVGTEPDPDILDDPSAGGRAIRTSGVRALGYVVGTLATLVSAPLMVRHLGVVDFGRYLTVLSLGAVVAGVTDVGLGALALREYSVRRGAERTAFMRNLLGARILLTALGAVAATAFAVIVGYGADLVVGTVLTGLGLVLGVAGATIGVPLAAGFRLGWMTLADVVLGKVLSVVLVVVLVLASADLVPFFAIPLVPGVILFALTVRLTRGLVPLRPSLDLREMRILLRETLPLAIATVVSTFYARIVLITMSLVATGLATGYFGTAIRVIDVAMGVPLLLVSTTFPIMARAAREDPERLRYTLQRVFEVALIGGIWMGLATALAADPIIAFVGGAEAEPAVGVLRILAFALIAAFLNVTWQHGLLALQRHRELLVTNAVGLVIIASLTFTLVPQFGARGAALAVVVADVCLAAASGVAVFRARRELRPQLAILPRVLAATALAAPVALAPVPGLVRALVMTAVYFSVLAALRALPHELRTAVEERKRPGSATLF